MSNTVLLGDEAVAQGAIDAGISTAYGYPGTPSTEIFEHIERVAKKDPTLLARWAANEKVAYEQAVGSSYAGRRTIVTMKHVGLNVAADPFVNSALTGVNGGLLLAVADDPAMHSSQNEQDSRFYAEFAYVPCFEPANQQESYDMARAALDFSERFELPAMLRLVTRLAHSRADVVTGERREQNPLAPLDDRARFTLLPGNARVQFRKLLDKWPSVVAASDEHAVNELVLNDGNRKLGVITAGVAYNYFREALGRDEVPSYLKIGLYPIPLGKLRALLDHVDELLIIEEGYPYIEKALTGLLGELPDGKRIRGRRTHDLPDCGELTPDLVAVALGKGDDDPAIGGLPLKPRPPQLCKGCPHRDAFALIGGLRELRPETAVFSDIGCYTLGFYPPYNGIDSCLDMGASIAMAKGAADSGMHPVLCVIGDSTFGHSGMTGLLTASFDNTNMVVIIVDNGTTAMTGTQDSMATGERLDRIVAGLDVDPAHIRLVEPLPKNAAENAKVLAEEVDYKGLSVIISRRQCIEAR